MIVLEDDAKLLEAPLFRFLQAVPELPSYIECVRLFASKSRNKKYWPVFENGGVVIAKFLRGHKSTTGYYLTPSAAKKFLAYGNRWAEPVDIEMDQFWANGVECFGLPDPCVTHNPDFDSAIDSGIDTKKARRGFMRLRWRWYLLKGKLLREIHNFRFKVKMPTQTYSRADT